ncbi:MAG: SDR family oxidoreductase [bacterium]|nr:SDR family oxidoreductase [bacterium]
MSQINKVKEQLRNFPKTWLITGVAGFIGSNLLEELLNLGQKVIGLDNFSTGHKHNLEDIKEQVGDNAYNFFTLLEGDIRNLDDCEKACKNVDYVLHQAALGSVPRSIDDPISTNQSNIDGFLNMLIAARNANVKRFVYAASSSTYGDDPTLPKKEDIIGNPMSPYAVTKYVNELYADVFSRIYNIECIGLRYFNVFGPRQDPKGAYAAVIPRWIGELLNNKIPTIYGDGETSRDFCYISNTIQANLLAATTEKREALNQVYNIAVGEKTTLNRLFIIIKKELGKFNENINNTEPKYADFRLGDVRHSLADIEKAKRFLEYNPTHDIEKGLAETIRWLERI